MGIREAMHSSVVTAKPNDNISLVVDRMTTERVGSVVIVDDDNIPVGIITNREVVRAVAAGADIGSTQVSEYMVGEPDTIHHAAGAAEAHRKSIDNNHRYLPVVDDDGKLISLHDMKHLLSDIPASAPRPVGDSMHSSVVTVGSDASVWDAVQSMVEGSTGSVVVVDADSVPVGIMTHCDVVHAAASEADLAAAPVAEHMASNLLTVNQGSDTAEARRLMSDNRYRYLPVVDDSGKLVGLYTLKHVVWADR